MFSTIRFPSLFVCFLIFIAWMHYKKRKAAKQQEKETDLFWEQRGEGTVYQQGRSSWLEQRKPF